MSHWAERVRVVHLYEAVVVIVGRRLRHFYCNILVWLDRALLALDVVPVVLDRVVGPARQALGNLSPSVAQVRVRFEEDLVLLLGPRRLLDRRVEVVVPSARGEKGECQPKMTRAEGRSGAAWGTARPSCEYMGPTRGR